MKLCWVDLFSLYCGHSTHISKTIACQRSESKSQNISKASHISEIPSRWKTLHLTSPNTKKKVQFLVDFFLFGRPHMLHSGKLLWSIPWGGWKLPLLTGALYKRRTHNSFTFIKVVPLVQLYDPTELMVLKISVAEKDAMWSLWQTLIRKYSTNLKGLKQKNFILCKLLFFWQVYFCLILGF